ncbi:hypothetical protein [Pseudobacillus badius]|uniref:hypothetical protein n=1 Tax=Bacillus badius TaxID=1455 RepID=UPI00059794A2|nr:hypothetical protein [Bacillus badius]KIL74052.1 hypothetical protein SD78_3110 [Bacillus badius]GLY11908.1 hypothetical protein Bbad01_31240 [Bacillus badius]
MNSLERAAKRKQQAEKILNELKLIEKWDTVGNCFIVGAAAYDLIVTPDIDLETFSELPNPQTIMNELALLTQHKNVIELKYRDYTGTDFNGHYFKLIYKADEIEWNIDMWLFSSERSGALSKDLVPFMKENLTEESRRAILDIKEALLELNEKYSSIFIYQAVLEFGIRHIDDFLEWAKNHNTAVPFHWQPKLLNNR